MIKITVDVEPTHIAIYRDGRIAVIARKFADFNKLGLEAWSGLMRIPDPEGGEAYEWTDHRQLLKLASEAASLAANSYPDAA